MKNIYILIEHLVNNWINNLSEALAPRVKQQLMDKFKQEADDFNIEIADKTLSDYIDYFDSRLKNNPKVTEKDLGKYTLQSLIKLVSSFKGSTSEEGEEEAANTPDVVYNENGLIIYSGHNEENCLKFGKGEQWCITRGSFGNYRYDSNRKNPTFYLVKDTNLPNSDRKSFFVVVVGSDNTYKVSDRSNNDVGGTQTEWNRWEPWSFVEQQFPSVQGLHSIFKYIPISKTEMNIQKYKNSPTSVGEWIKAPFSFKEQYLVIRKGQTIFNDISNQNFVVKILPKVPQIAEMIAKNYGYIDIYILLQEFDSFSPQNQKSIIANASRFTKIEPRIIKSDLYPFSAKKAIVKGNLLNIPNGEKYYITSDDKAIVQLKFENDGTKMGIFTENESHPNVKVNERTGKVIADYVFRAEEVKDENGETKTTYPNLDSLPLSSAIQLTKDKVLPKDTVNKMLQNAQQDPNSAIIIKDTDEGKIILDLNVFKAYKLVDGEFDQVPIVDDSVQNILRSESNNESVQNSVLKLFNGDDIPNGISMSNLIPIVNTIPYERRIVTINNEGYVLIPTGDTMQLWHTSSRLDSSSPSYKYLSNGYFSTNSNSNQEIWRTYFEYLRSQNLSYDSNQLIAIASRPYYSGAGGETFLRANPPLSEDNIYKVVEFEGTLYLVNKNNPRESKKILSSGKLGKANINPRLAASMLGTTPPPAPTRGRQARTATPQPTAPTGQANASVQQAISGAGLEQGFNALPTSLRNRILAGELVTNDNGFMARNRALGDRGRVTKIISSGQSRMYIIRLASGTYIAQASFQPEARHYIITTNTAFNMGRVGNFINALNDRNLREAERDVLARVALGAATPKELDEIKSKTKPYKDLEVTNEHIIREFDENIDPIELKWHRDQEDRIVEIIGETDWKVQLENQLPISMNQPIFIPKGEWHRVIKGNGTLTLKINKK